MITLSLFLAVGSYLLIAAYVMSWHMALDGDLRGVDGSWRFELMAPAARVSRPIGDAPFRRRSAPHSQASRYAFAIQQAAA